MLVVMRKDATAEQIRGVGEAIEARGFKAHPIPGAQRTAIGVTGNKGALDAPVFESLPGVIGPKEPVARFARLWEERTGADAQIGIQQRIYRASATIQPEGVPGSMRTYEDGDRELVIAWVNAFVDEALPEAPPEDAEGWLERNLSNPDGGIELWLDGGAPVSFAGYGGLTPNGIRVGPVYTPPELRRRGYATALVAEVTHMLLDRGRKFCFLFTDLANPTSNSIYQRIGYEAVSDSDQWVFGHR